MAKAKPRRRSEWPIGTRAELEGNKFWRLDEWPTCGPPDKNEGVLSCPLYADCPFRGGTVYDYPDMPVIRGVSGPAHFGGQIIKSSKASGADMVVHTILPCWDVIQTANRVELNGGVFRIIAMEGEKIDLSGSRPHDEIVPGQGSRRIYKPETIETEVPPYPRPHTNPALKRNAFAAEQSKKAAATRRTARSAEYLGEITTTAQDPPTTPPPTEGKPDGKRGKTQG